MEKVLLIITNHTLRQLYHELFVSESFEPVVSENVASALVMLTIHDNIAVVVLFDDQESEVQTLLRLRKRRRKWLRIPLVILTPEPALFARSLTKKDLLFNSLSINPTEVVDTIKTLFLR